MGYCVYMTRAGYALQAKLFAEGGELEITRTAVGSGVLPEDADWRTLTGLVEQRAAATSTKPLRRECSVGMEIEYRADLGGAVERARALARPGDVVIMSPASASFDRFKNFEERGNAFKDIVNALRS